MFLSIDSSAGTSVAVVSATGDVLAETSSEDPRGHAEIIGVLLRDALSSAGLSGGDVTHVVMGVGPGPFTGLRVGMAAAIAFSSSRSLPLLPVISHDSLGFSAPGDLVVVTDARRGEVAFSVYLADQLQRRVIGPELCRPEELDEALGAHSALSRLEASSIPASGLAQVARLYLENSLDFPAAQPVYLRAPDVTMPS